MKRLLFILVLIILTSLTACKQKQWTTIKEFKYYGFKNPTEKDSTYKFALADTDKIKAIFANVKKSDGYILKGSTRYATITFENKKTMTIQMIAGGIIHFRVVEKDIFKDKWYDIDETKTTEWETYLNELDKTFKK